MSSPSTLSKIWRIVKPIVTLGLSLLVDFIAKKNGVVNPLIEETGEAVKDALINEADSIAAQAPKNKQIN